MATSANLPPAKTAQDFSPAAPGVHHETSDASVGAVFAFGLALIIAGVIILFVVWLLFGYFKGREAGSGVPEFPLAVEQQNRLPPEPRLQTNPKQDLIDMRTKENATLYSYGWIDKTAGVVRIPISEAMKLTVERGLPARTATETKR
jgi:hypothetical protein